ncbi:MuF-C-terminal domain-containing protein [Sediminispirochaeta smaragdinae]|uniref:Phage MuF C-terminal domain-containing protein n=1 Tax=Sediminispirochaeta smaragdinae (strain DSM 11293 / JCM 15392 / SEBR 4228) TaxID=573413 RepID=E1R231_SEDSS|nr:hypothetical protein [Sediminispirochaeta smaragdinae]ADK81916.1 hypothetical protein Spirs_2813 [Sediminispirochaeta smaragdinae DSM 11293]
MNILWKKREPENTRGAATSPWKTDGFRIVSGTINSLDQMSQETEPTPGEAVEKLKYKDAFQQILEGTLGDGFSDESLQKQFYQVAMAAKNPEEEMAKMATSAFLSQRLNAPPDVVYKNFDFYTEKYMTTKQAPLSAWAAIKNEAYTSQLMIERGKIGYELMFDPENQELWDKLLDINEKVPPQDNQKRSVPIELVKGAAKFLPYVATGAIGSADESMFGAGLGAVAAASLASAGTLSGVLTVPSLILSGYQIGKKVGSMDEYFKISAGNTYADTMQKKSADGKTVPVGIARAFALASGTLAGALDTIQLDRFVGGSQWLRKAVPQAVKKSLQDSWFSAILGNPVAKFAGRWGSSVAESVVEETFQETIEMMGTEVAVTVANWAKNTNIPQATIDDWKDMWMQTIRDTAKGTTLLALPGVTAESFAAEHQKRQSAKDREAALASGNADIDLGKFNDYAAIFEEEDLQKSTEKLVAWKSAELKKAEQRLASDPTQENFAMHELQSQELDRAELEASVAKKVSEPRVWEMTQDQWIAQKQRLSDQELESLKTSIAAGFPGFTDQELEVSAIAMDTIARNFGQTGTALLDTMLTIVPADEGQAAVETLFPGKSVSQTNSAATFFRDAEGKLLSPTEAARGQAKAFIASLSSPDLSTFLHEYFHFADVMLISQSPEHRQLFSKALGKDYSQFTDQDREYLAYMFEKYHRDGTAPTPELKSLFARIATSLKQFVERMVGLKPMNEDLRKAYDALYSLRSEDIKNDNPDLKEKVVPIKRYALFQAEPNEREGFQRTLREAFEYKGQGVIKLSNRTPEALKASGAKDLPIVLTRKSLEHIRKDHPNIPKLVLLSMLDDISDPVMVFDSASNTEKRKGFVIVTNQIVDDAPVVIAMHLEVGKPQWQIHKIASEYEKNSYKTVFSKWVDQGLLRYVDKERALNNPHISAGLRLPLEVDNSRPLLNKVVLKTDLVNNKQTKPLFQALSPLQKLKQKWDQEIEKAEQELAEAEDRVKAGESFSVVDKALEHLLSLQEERELAIRDYEANRMTDHDAYSDAVEASVQKTVENGDWVPDSQLKDYSSQNWARDEIEYRQQAIEDAGKYADKDEYIASQVLSDNLEDGHTPEYYGNIFDASRETEANLTGREANYRFIKSLSADYLSSELLEALHVFGSDGLSGWHPIVKNAALSLKKGKKLSQALYKKVMDQIKADPEVYRMSFAEAAQDTEGMRQIQWEIEHSEETELEKQLKANRQLRRQNEKLNKSVEALNREIDLTNSVLGDYKRKQEGLEEAFRSAREEARKGDVESRKQWVSLLSDARKEAYLQTRRAVADTKQKIRDMRDAKAFYERMIKAIMRPAGRSIAYDQQVQIREIQGRYVARFTRREKEMRQAYRKLLSDAGIDPRIKEAIQENLSKQSLRDLSPEEIESLHAEIAALRTKGREIREAQLATEHITRQSAIQNVLETLGFEKPEEGLGLKKTERGRNSSILQKERLTTLLPSHIAEMFDGGKKGSFYRWLIVEVEKAKSEAINNKDRRMNAGYEEMKKLGIKPKDLIKERSIDGLTFQVQEIMGLYVYMQNESERERLLYGNRIKPETIAKAIKTLTPEQKAFADWMIDSFETDYSRFESAFIADQNTAMGKEKRYFPMMVKDLQFDTKAQEIASDLLSRSHAVKSFVSRGSTHNRIKISREHQPSMRLDAFNIWATNVDRQEDYINNGLLVKRLHAIFGNREVQEAIIQRYGKDAANWLKDQINEIAKPLAGVKYYEPIMQLSQKLRSHVGLAALAWNALTPLKQFPSLFLAMGRVPAGELLAASGRLIASGTGLVKKMHELDPYMRAMDYDPVLTEMREADKNRYERFVTKTGELGMKGIFVVDKAVKSIIWDAVYEHNLKQGKTQDEAIHEARRAIIETQPGGFREDLPVVARQGEFFKWMTLFSSQLQKLYNMTTYDIPQAVKQGDIATALRMSTGYIMAAVLIGMINKKSTPEDAKDAGSMVLEQLVTSIPILGSLFVQGAKGWSSSNPVTETANQVGKVINAIGKDKSDEQVMKTVMDALEQALFLGGLPTVQANRMIDFAETGDPWEIVGGRSNE